MRKIKFRGRAFFDGEWVHGHYFRDGTHNEIARIRQSDGKVSSVTPSTVGQYTGLRDVNGVEIYEGDIVRVTNDDGSTEFSDGGVGSVGGLEELLMWYIDGDVQNGLYDIKMNCYIEVIGNIHDNPELLEVQL